MYFPSKPILALGLVGSLASASPTPSLTTSVISGTSIAPHATSQAALNATKIVRRLEYKNEIPVPERHEDDHCVGHTTDRFGFGDQEDLAYELVPSSWVCPDPSICREDMRYFTPKVHEAVQKVLVDMEQVDNYPLTIQVNITNNGTGPITFWKDLSPISDHALYLGYFHFHTKIDGTILGERTLVDAQGYRPECYEDLIELKAGESVSKNIKLPNGPRTPESRAWRKLLELAGDATLTMSGNWYGIWPGTKEQVMASDMNWSLGGPNYWSDMIIPWEARFPVKSQKVSPGVGLAMGLDLD